MNPIDLQLLRKIRENPKIRKHVANESPLWFSMHYLQHLFPHPFAPFHIELFHLLAMEEEKFIAVMAFRESGKSTIMNTANVLWSILGKPQKKFVLIVSKTQEQAKNHFTNIKSELEQNGLLKADFGPFIESKDEWNKLSLELEYHGAKIMSVSREQSVRGIKYGQFRPDLIICDDLEDIASSAKAEGAAIYRRFESEIMPLGSTNTRIIVLGNLISEHSFLMRLKDDIQAKRVRGVFRAYPLIDDEGYIMWPGKFPSGGDISLLRERISGQTWAQEYLLKVSSGTYYDRPSADYDSVLEKYGPIFHEMRLAYHRELEKAGAPIFQVPLVSSMHDYRIMLPSAYTEDPSEGEPYYDLYLNYQRAREEVMKAYRKDRTAWWHQRIDAMP